MGNNARGIWNLTTPDSEQTAQPGWKSFRYKVSQGAPHCQQSGFPRSPVSQLFRRQNICSCRNSPLCSQPSPECSLCEAVSGRWQPRSEPVQAGCRAGWGDLKRCIHLTPQGPEAHLWLLLQTILLSPVAISWNWGQNHRSSSGRGAGAGEAGA